MVAALPPDDPAPPNGSLPAPAQPARIRALNERARAEAEHPSPQAMRTLALSRAVNIIDYPSFSLDKGTQLPRGDGLIQGGDAGLFCASAGRDHVAQVRVEVWSATPPRDTSERWEVSDTSVFVSDEQDHVFTGADSQVGEAFHWAAKGAYGVRAYSAGRAALTQAQLKAREGELKDIEHWLLQFWPLAEAAQ